MVGNGGQPGLCVVAGTETVLGWGEEVVGWEIVLELVVDRTFDYFGDHRDNGYVTGTMDMINIQISISLSFLFSKYLPGSKILDP